MAEIISYQMELCQSLPEIIGSIDYKIYKDQLLRVEEIIEKYELEKIVIGYNIELKKRERDQKKQRKLSKKEMIKIQKQSIQALRCSIARHLMQDDYRGFSCRLADSVLLQSFCKINNIGKIQIPGKSVLQRYEQMFPEEVIRIVIETLTKSVIEKSEKIKLEAAVSTKKVYYDTTCIETNIHFPVDWILLRDAVRTLMKATILIRKAGLRNRMDNPLEFIKLINKSCIKMTYTRRRKKGKKMRKAILRQMKKLLKKVERHAMSHYELLKNNWAETNLSENQAKQILKRIEDIQFQLPAAIHQAHERIIGERQVAAEDKILSLYEPDTNIIVRGKLSAEVEYGNKLLLCETECGLILDWKLYKEGSPSDSKMIPESLKKIELSYGKEKKPEEVTGDRGFVSKESEKYLKENNIKNYICPRSIEKLNKCLEDEIFCENQNRRSQTEGRISIFKNNFLGKPFRSKGFKSRNLQVALNVLAHNLWVIARLPQKNIQAELKTA